MLQISIFELQECLKIAAWAEEHGQLQLLLELWSFDDMHADSALKKDLFFIALFTGKEIIAASPFLYLKKAKNVMSACSNV